MTKVQVYFTIDIPEEVMTRINDDNDDLDFLEVVSTLDYSITSPYVSEVQQVNEYDVWS